MMILSAFFTVVPLLMPSVQDTASVSVRISVEEAISALSGTGDISEMPYEDLENYMSLAEKPLRINQCSRAELLASGLFSEYQTAVVLDWRSRHGDILSVRELGVLDGFGERIAEATGVFLDFSSGERRQTGSRWDATLLGALKDDSGKQAFQIGAKAAANAGTEVGTIGASVAARKNWDSVHPEEIGWSISWDNDIRQYGDAMAVSASVVLGSYNARFGQGLLCWSGTVIDSYADPASLMRRPSGISAYRSWSPSNAMSGAALRLDIGRICIRPIIDLGAALTRTGAGWQGCSGGGNIAWNHSNGQMGINMVFGNGHQGYSIDFQQTIRGMTLYGEGCIEISQPDGRKSSAAALLGATGSVSDLCIGARLLLSGLEHNITSSLAYDSPDRKHKASLGNTISYYPEAKGHTPAGGYSMKVRGEYSCSSIKDWHLNTRAGIVSRSLTERSDPDAPWASNWASRRYEIRQDVRWEHGPISISGRLDGVRGISEAGMCNLELGYRITAGTKTVTGFWIQGGVFRADNWDDRIYVYMRDAPGGFSVPALYGRGWWTSAYGKIGIGKHWTLYLRTLYTAYPWAREGDTHTAPSLNFKIQLAARF